MSRLLIERLTAQAERACYRGAYGEAVGFFKRILEYDATNLGACAALSAYYESKKDYGEAIGYLRQLMEVRRRNPEYLFDLARLTALSDDLPAALELYDEVVAKTRTSRERGPSELRRKALAEIRALSRQVAIRAEADSRSARDPKRKGPETRVEPPAPAQALAASPASPTIAPIAPIAPIPVKTVLVDPEWSFLAGPPASSTNALRFLRLRLDFHRLTLLGDYDELVCLSTLHGVEKYWYQIETVKKVLRDFRGRVLLADEVGLGKTIEAAMALKEFLLRGLARTVLILTPPGLVSQWKEELETKFDLTFRTTDEAGFAEGPGFWESERVIASINLAKSKAHAEQVTKRDYDLVIVDEAHRLKNRETLAWKLVNSLKKRYVFFLSATPVENDLIELYNLITLLQPGTLKTEAEFRKQYTKRGNPREAANPEALRELLRSVMIRNTRSLVDVKLPKRFAVTLLVEPSPLEREIYDGVTNLVRERSRMEDGRSRSRLLLSTLVREAGSSGSALRETLAADPTPEARHLVECIDRLFETEKSRRLVRLLGEKRGEKVLVFSQFKRTLEELAAVLSRNGILAASYHGSLASEEKQRAIRRFREEASVLLSTESGGEGHNLQFASTIVNFDLPWNPMKIEQRIGRLHRIGQTRDVFIFNLASRGTLEERLLAILDQKINLFELVVGEVDMILGHLDEEKDFDDVIFDLWRAAASHEEAETLFNDLGEKLVRARSRYRESLRIDEALFGKEFEA